jgi:4-diphosphocytidyl-2-C-methyl-D-erythritol kinase
MICFPNAKINLGLNVVSKRTDGYHNIETVFYPIPVKDALEIVNAEKLSFTQTGIQVDAPMEKNLVIKALNLLKTQYEIPSLEIHLLKAIPFGAGLGGGSADAAFMLKLLNDFCKLDIHADELEKIAASIGADCPFFIRNTPVFATGTGNIFEPVIKRLSFLPDKTGCSRFHSGGLFISHPESSGNLTKRDYKQTGFRMEKLNDK